MIGSFLHYLIEFIPRVQDGLPHACIYPEGRGDGVKVGIHFSYFIGHTWSYDYPSLQGRLGNVLLGSQIPNSNSIISIILKEVFRAASNLSLFLSLFSFSFLAILQDVEFPGQGSHLSCRCDLCHSCGNTRSLTH